jgi:transposase
MGGRDFYASLEGPVVVGIEATGAMQWFLELLEELGIECRVGHPAKIRAAETRVADPPGLVFTPAVAPAVNAHR